MTDPLTLSGDRVMIASPEYDWERQTVNTNGYSLRYPVYVVEHPVFFSDEKSDKAYIFYTASAGWTAFSCIGELSAEKLSDFLDPASWTKSPVPVFTQDREAAVYGPSAPYFIPSKDGKRWYLVYSAVPDDKQPNDRVICLKPVTFDEAGHPVLGQPTGWDERVIKASATPRR